MKTGNQIDDLFREAMTGYQVDPTLSLWRRIERRFFPPSRFSPSGLITSGILIFIAGLMPWVLIPASGGQPKEEEVQREGTLRGYIISPDPGTDASLNASEKTYSVQTTYFKEDPSPTYGAANPTGSDLSQASSDDASAYLLANADPDTYYLPVYASQDPSETYREATWIFRMHSHPAGLMDARYTTSTQPVRIDPSVKKAFTDEYESDYFKKSDLSMGGSFNPSLVFYDPNPNNKMLGGEANIRYSVSNWNITGGVGYSRMSDVGTYNVNYKSYDSVGYFFEVVSFIPDPRDPGNIVYTTQKKTIYDSVPHYDITEKTNHYSYLDFPVSIGYTVFQRGRVSFGVNTGIKFSVLVGKDEPTVDFTVPNGELTDIERQVPPRLNTNWRFTAGLDFGYLLTDRMSFHLEPNFEQYITPVYAKQPGIITKKPYVTGLKAGFRYTFK
jgi:hypothetical protein